MMELHNPFALTGKTILVTGASSGIGRSIAVEAAGIGATVIVTARNEERLKECFRVSVLFLLWRRPLIGARFAEHILSLRLETLES